MCAYSQKIQYQKLNSNIVVINYKTFFTCLFFILIISIITIILIHLLQFNTDYSYEKYEKIALKNVLTIPMTIISNKNEDSTVFLQENCSHWSCFNIYRCGSSYNSEHISIYVYPLKRYVNTQSVDYTGAISKEFYEILDSIINSKYYNPDPTEACLFVPSIDTLNLNRVALKNLSTIFSNLKFWNGDGENHLLFTMFGININSNRKFSNLPTGKSIMAIAGLSTWQFRFNYDVPVPVYSPLQRLINNQYNNQIREWLAVCVVSNMHNDIRHDLESLEQIHSNSLLVLKQCKQSKNSTTRCRHTKTNNLQVVDSYYYPNILKSSTFCLIVKQNSVDFITQALKSIQESIAANCIPVVIIDNLVMPFSPEVDWNRAAIFILERNVNNVINVLKSQSQQHIIEMQEQVRWLYTEYFESIRKITLTTLDILQDRIYPYWARVYDSWNIVPSKRSQNPLFLPLRESRASGFTAVILTYDRVQSLFQLIEKLSKVPSLVKILVIWNNQKKSPPSSHLWPKINKSLQFIETKANKLSNRFYPYKEIETEAILSIDDDIVMLTSDELEFGYEVWKEFPDRIVGFPSRTHRWDNITNSWRYESEWTNDISMVLTGAAFIHKYWTYAYTNLLPTPIMNWVDQHMNCEDIAMNFLVSNITNKAPIKVAPRKKFKCPECTNTEMLSADLGHLKIRSDCINRFTHIFGRMPLKSVEFRADPVLYLDPFPEKLKRFNDIGSL